MRYFTPESLPLNPVIQRIILMYLDGSQSVVRIPATPLLSLTACLSLVGSMLLIVVWAVASWPWFLQGLFGILAFLFMVPTIRWLLAHARLSMDIRSEFDHPDMRDRDASGPDSHHGKDRSPER